MAQNNSLNNTSGTSTFSSPNFLQGYTTTVTTNGSTTITSASTQLQFLTGINNQNFVLPAVSTLALGWSYTVVNLSSGAVSLQSSGMSVMQAMLGNSIAIVTCISLTGTGGSSWSFSYSTLQPTSQANITGGVANDILYQTAASTTGFIVPSNNAVLCTNGSGVPAWQSTVPVANIPIDANTITSTGSVIQASGTFTGGIVTVPVSSHTATTGFSTSLTAGTAVQNTLTYDILVNICVSVTSSTTATITLGVGSTSTPTVDTAIPSSTVAATTYYNLSAIVPANYYLLVNTTGTIVVASITVQSNPL